MMTERVDREMEEMGLRRDGDVLVPSSAESEPTRPSRKDNRFGDTIAKYASEPLQNAWGRVMDAGVIDADPDDAALLTALKRSNDYLGDMAMAGLDTAEAGAKAVAAAVGEIFGGDTESEERLTDDLLAMPEAFAGGGVGRGVNLLDDVLDVAPKAVSSTVNQGARGLERLNESAIESYRSGTVGSNFGNVGKTEAPFDANRGSGVELPPAENAQRTQIAGTFPTYEKAAQLLADISPDGKTLDFGAGLGKSRELGFDTYEPFPREGFDPTYRSADSIPDGSYDKVTNLNVLNVVPKEVRDQIVLDIGRVLRPGGSAVITTRGRDVLSAKGTAGPEPMSVITGRGTYQKGFTPAELKDYVQTTLGDDFEVANVKLGPAGVVVKKRGSNSETESLDTQTVLGLRANEMMKPVKDRLQPSGSQPLFDFSPESYERSLPKQRETYVPRQPEGTNKPLPKGDRGRAVQDMSDKIADRLAERMQPWLGTEAQYFYHTGPIVDKARDMGFSDEEIYGWMKEFADAYAATSPRTETAQNIRNATLALAKRQLNVDLADVIGPGGDGINEKGYPMMIGESGIHRRLLDKTQDGGIVAALWML